MSQRNLSALQPTLERPIVPCSLLPLIAGGKTNYQCHGTSVLPFWSYRVTCHVCGTNRLTSFAYPDALCVLPALYAPTCQAVALHCKSHVTVSRISILDPANGISLGKKVQDPDQDVPRPLLLSISPPFLQKNKNKNKNNTNWKKYKYPLAQHGKFKKRNRG